MHLTDISRSGKKVKICQEYTKSSSSLNGTFVAYPTSASARCELVVSVSHPPSSCQTVGEVNLLCWRYQIPMAAAGDIKPSKGNLLSQCKKRTGGIGVMRATLTNDTGTKVCQPALPDKTGTVAVSIVQLHLTDRGGGFLQGITLAEIWALGVLLSPHQIQKELLIQTPQWQINCRW